MSIILAIEPDRRRAAQLTGMARAHLQAELLVASTAAQAVEALGGRVPDVLLTAPLLQSHEETAMADYLRQLGPAAAHVQTLTIPLLASSSGDRDRPVLSAFRRDRGNRSEPEGCDPAVFAEQITEYLREAQERRDTSAPPARPAAVVETAQPRLATRSGSERLARLLAAAVEEERDDFGEFAVAPTNPVVAMPDDAPGITLLRPVRTASDDDDTETFERETTPTLEPAASFGEDESRRPLTNVKLFAFTVGGDDPELPDISITPAADVPAAVVAPQRRRVRRAQPARDEWGFFDPNQCGFPALIAKLDEIASRESDS